MKTTQPVNTKKNMQSLFSSRASRMVEAIVTAQEAAFGVRYQVFVTGRNGQDAPAALCSFETLSRTTAQLVAQGYTVSRVESIDMEVL